MKKSVFAMVCCSLAVSGCMRASGPQNPDGFCFPGVDPDHSCMQALLANAMEYLNPSNGFIEEVSGYPVEGWNHDPERAVYLRSFTQLTAIGEWLELLANIAAGYADNPYVSREEALVKLNRTLGTLLADQSNPALSSRGLLVNFLDLDGGGRRGPLGEEVDQKEFVAEFGEQKAADVWAALAARRWIVPQQDGSFAKIVRKEAYGDKFFTGELASFSDPDTVRQIMAVLDRRVVQIIFGDNANLTASVAKAAGALRHSTLRDEPEAVRLCEKLEQFIAVQEEGYRYLFDPESGTFAFGWNATHDRFTGWEDANGKWIAGRMDYFMNEFRGPLCFVVQRFGLPSDAVRKSGFQIKPYRLTDGRDLYAPAVWHGSAFQSLGLSLFMQETEAPGWRESLENSVDIHLDFAVRNRLPGFLSEAYSGNGTEYTGDIGIPELAVTDHPRITDAPSLYTLGVAYSLAPDRIEAFLNDNRKTIRRLFTSHGPWEGWNTSRNEVIAFQTSAHTLALILGGIGSSGENMQRYLNWQGISSLERVMGGSPEPLDLLNGTARWIPWSPLGDRLDGVHWRGGFRLRGDAVRSGAVTVKTEIPGGAGLSNGALLIRYRSPNPPLQAVLTVENVPRVFETAIRLRFDRTESEKEIRIPMPATPALENVRELILRFGDPASPAPVDLTVSRFEFVP